MCTHPVAHEDIYTQQSEYVSTLTLVCVYTRTSNIHTSVCMSIRVNAGASHKCCQRNPGGGGGGGGGKNERERERVALKLSRTSAKGRGLLYDSFICNMSHDSFTCSMSHGSFSCDMNH